MFIKEFVEKLLAHDKAGSTEVRLIGELRGNIRGFISAIKTLAQEPDSYSAKVEAIEKSATLSDEYIKSILERLHIGDERLRSGLDDVQAIADVINKSRISPENLSKDKLEKLLVILVRKDTMLSIYQDRRERYKRNRSRVIMLLLPIITFLCYYFYYLYVAYLPDYSLTHSSYVGYDERYDYVSDYGYRLNDSYLDDYLNEYREYFFGRKETEQGIVSIDRSEIKWNYEFGTSKQDMKLSFLHRSGEGARYISHATLGLEEINKKVFPYKRMNVDTSLELKHQESASPLYSKTFLYNNAVAPAVNVSCVADYKSSGVSVNRSVKLIKDSYVVNYLPGLSEGWDHMMLYDKQELERPLYINKAEVRREYPAQVKEVERSGEHYLVLETSVQLCAVTDCMTDNDVQLKCQYEDLKGKSKKLEGKLDISGMDKLVVYYDRNNIWESYEMRREGMVAEENMQARTDVEHKGIIKRALESTISDFIGTAEASDEKQVSRIQLKQALRLKKGDIDTAAIIDIDESLSDNGSINVRVEIEVNETGTYQVSMKFNNKPAHRFYFDALVPGESTVKDFSVDELMMLFR